MNKIRIATNEKALTVRLPDAEAEFWFGTLCRALLDEWPQEACDADALPDAGQEDGAADTADEETADEEADTEPPLESEPAGEIDEPEETPPVAEESVPGEMRKQYKGFLRIVCEHCGKVHSFCPREPIAQYRCAACGKYTPLRDLCRLFLNCECGAKYVYWTNATEELIELACLNCKMPVALERNKQGRYVTLQS